MRAEREINRVSAALAGYEGIAKTTTFSPSTIPIFRACCRCSMPREISRRPSAARLRRLPGLDLSQTGKLRTAADTVYRHALGYALLPRLIWRLETQMRGNFTNPYFLYEATRVYLMLGGQGPLDRALVKEWMAYDGRWRMAAPTTRPRWPDLRPISIPSWRSPCPGCPGRRARGAGAHGVRQVPLAARVYSRLKPSARCPGFAAVAAERRAWTRRAESLRASVRQEAERGVPGYLTVDGFHRALLPALPAAAREAGGESWIMGRGRRPA